MSPQTELEETRDKPTVRERPAHTALVPRGPGEVRFLDRERVNVVRRLFKKGKDQLSDAEIAYVLSEAARTKLDPVRQLAVWRDNVNGKIVIHTKIDGLLALAERTGHYRGAQPTRLTWAVPETEKPDSKRTTVELPMALGPPAKGADLVAATCAVRRDDFPEPIEVTRYWADSAPKDIKAGSSWDRMGALMLEKVALAGALRRAFPQDLAGLYESAELNA